MIEENLVYGSAEPRGQRTGNYSIGNAVYVYNVYICIHNIYVYIYTFCLYTFLYTYEEGVG